MDYKLILMRLTRIVGNILYLIGRFLATELKKFNSIYEAINCFFEGWIDGGIQTS